MVPVSSRAVCGQRKSRYALLSGASTQTGLLSPAVRRVQCAVGDVRSQVQPLGDAAPPAVRGEQSTSALSLSGRRTTMLGALLLSGAAMQPRAVHAAELPGMVLRILPNQPQPVMFPRKVLATNLAVLMMRSSYETMDELDFIAQDAFQVSPTHTAPHITSHPAGSMQPAQQECARARA